MTPLRHDEAWTELRPAVRALIAHVLRQPVSSAEVEDCTSEVFCRALEGHARLHESAPLRPWLLGIARHVALDCFRARLRRQAHDSHDTRDSCEAVENVRDREPDPFQQLLLSEKLACLRGAAHDLPSWQQRAFLLHAQGLEYREIAEQLEVPIGTVSTWIARARRHVLETVRGRISIAPL